MDKVSVKEKKGGKKKNILPGNTSVLSWEQFYVLFVPFPSRFSVHEFLLCFKLLQRPQCCPWQWEKDRFNKGKRHECDVLKYPTIYSLVLGYAECFCSSWGRSSVSNKLMAQSACTQPLCFSACGFRRFTAHLTCRHSLDVPVPAKTEVCGNR